MLLPNLINFIELITFIFGVIAWKKYSQSYLKYFLVLLGLTVILEFSMLGLKVFFDRTFLNNFIYNIWTSVQYIYYFTLYYTVLDNRRYKRVVKGLLISFIVSAGFNFVFIQKLMVDGPFHSYSFTIGAVLLIITIGLFFAEILKTDKILIFKGYLMFWISIGLFVFYTAIIPVILSVNFLPKGIAPNAYSAILFTLNLMMYACFSIGFIISDKYTTAQKG